MTLPVQRLIDLMHRFDTLTRAEQVEFDQLLKRVPTIVPQFLDMAKQGNHGGVETLLKAGVDQDSTDKLGNTALHFACMNGHLLIVKALVRAGANKNAKNKRGATPCDAAKIAANPAILKELGCA